MKTGRSGQAGATLWWVLAIVVLLIAAFVAWRWYQHSPQQPATAMQPGASATAPAAVATAPRYPVAAIAATTPAPASSAAPAEPESGDLLDSIAALPGGTQLSALLNRPDLIQHLVATVDALPGKRLSAKVLPVKPPAGRFLVATRQDSTVISPDNATRYAPYLQAFESLDTAALVHWYKRHYDQFEQAYQQLGYPQGHFNDRLVAVIDNLLAAPELQTPPVLVPGKSGWAYANANLESLSAGQKLLLRLPADEQARVRSRLRALRTALTGGEISSGESPRPAPAGTSLR